MRLSEIATILEHNIQYLLPPLAKAEKVNTDTKLQGLIQLRKAVNEIERTGLFKETIQGIYNCNVFATHSDYLHINSLDYNELSYRINQLHESAYDLIETIRNTIPKCTTE